MLIVDFYVFKQILANPRKYFSAAEAQQLEKLPGLNNFCNLLEDLIFNLCREELQLTLVQKFTSKLWMTSTPPQSRSSSQNDSSAESLFQIKNFLNASHGFCKTLHEIFRPLEEKDVAVQLDETHLEILPLKQFTQPLFRLFSALESLPSAAFTNTFLVERSKGCFAYIERRDQFDALAKNYLKLREMYNMIAVIHSQQPAKEFREILDKLQKIPLPSSLLATCDYKILLERYDELLLQKKNLESPAMVEMFQEINRHPTAFSLKELIRATLGNKNIPISYLPNLLSIGFMVANDPKDSPQKLKHTSLNDLIQTTSTKDFTTVKQTAMDLVKFVNVNRYEEKIPLNHLEHLVHGAHLQIRLSFLHTVSYQSTPEEITEYILKKYYLQPYPNARVDEDQSYRRYYGFDHISRVVLLLQLLVRFYNLPRVFSLPNLQALDKEELRLLTLAVSCYAADNINENPKVVKATIFRSEALLLGFPIDKVEAIAWALENKDNHAVPRNFYQWLIHDSIRFDELRFVKTLGKDELVDTFKHINPAYLPRFKRLIEHYAQIVTRFMASDRLRMQQSDNPFLDSKALLYQIAIDFAVFPSSRGTLELNPSYLVLGEIDPLVLFDPSPELLKHALNKLYDELRNTNSDQPVLSVHGMCFELYSLISCQISDPLAELADYHNRNSLSPETAYVLATRYLDNHQSAKLTATPEFKKLWDCAAAQMRDDLFTFTSSLVRNRKIPFYYVSNAISIATHLYGSPSFAEYHEAVAKQDLETLTRIGANLLEQASKKTSQDHPVNEELKQLAVGPLQQIRLPTGILFEGKLLNPSSSVGEIAQYIIHKHYLNKPTPIHPYKRLPWCGAHLNFSNLLSRTILIFQLMIRLLREYAPETLRDQKGTFLSERQLCLVAIAILCHDASTLTDFFKNETLKIEIFKSEATSLGFSDAEIEPIALALENKENKNAPHNIYHWLIHQANGLHNIKGILDHLESIHKKELSYKTLKKDELTRFNRIIKNYETIFKSLLSSRQVGENSFLATKEILFQIAFNHAINPLVPMIDFDTRYLALGDVDPLLLLDSGPELIRYTMGKLYHDMVTEKFKGEVFESCQEIYFNLFKLISSQKSWLLGRVAKYLCDKIYPIDSILQIADSFLDDDTVIVTAMAEFQRLWLHAANRIDKFFKFISDLLCNTTIPFSYLSNATSIALHLLDTPYLAEYMYAASENLPAFQKKGARLLEQAHQYIFVRPAPNAALRLLALGDHQQIRYPQRVKYKGKFLNSQSPIEEIAPYIIRKYYLRPYSAIPALPHYLLLRPVHGFDHVSRALLLFQLVVRFLQVYCPDALRNPGGTPLSDMQLRLIALAVLCHNAANTHEYFKDEAAQAEIFRKEALLLGFHNEGIEHIAWALENKDNKSDPRTIFQWLIHDPGCFEFIRNILESSNSFLNSELDISTVLTTSEAHSKLNRITDNYVKILTRFMASCRMSLQESKNSFLASKALLYQIALDLAINPSNKGGLSNDPRYLVLGDVDPLLLFDPGPELLKYAMGKFHDEMKATKFIGPETEFYREIYFNLFTHISCQISEPLGELAKYLCHNLYVVSIESLSNRYLIDDTVKLTATPDFKKLWLHAASKIEKFFGFVTRLLSNTKIPFSYLPNAISIALHLLNTPYLAEYSKASNDEDFTTFRKTGARLLDQAHKFLYPDQSEDPELKQLAVGAHQQICYPERPTLEGKLINNQSSIEEIALYIIQKYYLQPYSKQSDTPSGLLRPLYGFDHAARALLLFQLVVRLLKQYHPIALRNPNGTPFSETQLRLVALAVLCQDAAQTNDYFKDETASVEIFRKEASLLGFRNGVIDVARSLESKDNKTQPRTIFQWLIHDPDRFEFMRTILSTLDPSRKSELDIATVLTTAEASAKLERIIAHYKKIITRFMASNRVPLQSSKNSFLATKALLCQIALDLAINPSNTGGVDFDAGYLVLDDVDPLLLFDPGPLLLKYAFEKIYAKMTATNRQGPEFETCLKIYFNLFTLFSCKISEPLAQIAKYNCGLSHHPCAIVLKIANRYLSDNTVNLTATPEFIKLWLHAADIVEDLASFISDLLVNSSIPFSYLPNAISIALHLAGTSYLHQYKMSANEDLATFSKTGATLLEHAHRYLFAGQSPDAELIQLALGAHQQIRYPQRVKFEGKLLNHQSSVEELASYIIKKYYLKSYAGQPVIPNVLLRPLHGFDHASRALLIFQLGVRLLQEYAPEALRDQTGTSLSDRQLRLVALAVLCHEAANTDEDFKNDAAQAEIFRSEALLLGFSAEEVKPIAWALENKDNKTAPRNIFQWLIHDPDWLESMRVNLNDLNSFRKSELDLTAALIKPEGSAKFNRIIDNYKNIITRFMASPRVPLQVQAGKNSFLATKALLYQIAFDLAANPSNTSGIDYDPDYLILGDIDPLLLFDPSSELLKHAFNKINREILADISESAFQSYRKIYFNLFKLVGYQISKPLGDIANYHCKNLASTYSLHKQAGRLMTRVSLSALTNRFLNDNLVNLTATEEFQKLWRHAESKLEQFFGFIVSLLINPNIPLSYLYNAICVALHLLDTPYLAEYMKPAEVFEDLVAFSNKGARLLEQAHKHLFPNQPVDPELRQLALGAHPQIRYPQRVMFEGKLLNHQSAVEELASYINKKYYLKSYPGKTVAPNSLFRPYHGFDHASRALLIFQLGVSLLRKYAPEALRDQTGTPLSDRQLRLVALAVLCHDAANTDEVFHDEAAQAEIFRSEALLLGFNAEEIKPIAWALEHKDSKNTTRNIFQWLIHDPDCLEYMRVIPNNLNLFERSRLDLAKVLIKPEASATFQRIISNYEKIITRFMAVDKVVLMAFQITKNSFLATKALLCQIAVELAINPSNTEGVDFNARYLVLDDVDPLLLFDFGPELLQYAVTKLYHEIVTPDKKSSFRENRELYFNLFTLISCQISEPLGNLAKYLCKELKVVPIHSLAKRYLNDNEVTLTRTTEFKKLWLHAESKLEKFFEFVTNLLWQREIPFSYLSNAISIALHLSDTPYLAEYLSAANQIDNTANQNLAVFTWTGARLLEQAHKHFFPNQSIDLELMQLALGAHQQIRYPNRVVFEGKLLTYQSSVEDIAPYIIRKYYLQPYTKQLGSANGLFRPLHGFDHAARALLIFQLVVSILRENAPEKLRDQKGTALSEMQLRLVALAVLCHDAANTQENYKNEAEQAKIFKTEALLLGFRGEEIEHIAWALENKDNKTTPRNIYQWLIHDPDCLEFMRIILNNLYSFRTSELDFATVLIQPEARAKFERIINNYKKIITRFMASDRVSLMASKNSFLATKTLLYQIALDLVINPSATGGVIYDPNYLALCNGIDSSLFFDPGPELIKRTFKNLAFEMIKRQLKDPEPYRTIYFNLFIRTGYSISEPMGLLAKYDCGKLSAGVECGLQSPLVDILLNDKMVTLTATPEFKKLWFHAVSKLTAEKFYPFVLKLLIKKVPFSYLPNVISIALHLSDTPYLADYLSAAQDKDVEVFILTGARLLEQAHKHLFPNKPADPALKELALGDHQQIRYPERVIFEGKILTYQSPVEEIAPYIIQKYYLQSYPGQPVVPNVLLRPFHGFDHAARALLLFQLVVRLLREYHPTALRNPDGTPLSESILRLVALAVLCHDAANTQENFKNEAAQAEIFRAEALLLGFTKEEIEPIAQALENKDTKGVARTIFQSLIHDPDCLEYMRIILKNLDLFRKSELDVVGIGMFTREAKSKLDNIIEGYKKIITRFMASNRVSLQTSKNSFSATKALLYQVAIDVAAFPSLTTNVVLLDTNYLWIGDIDPLILFDPGPELLKFALKKVYQTIVTAKKEEAYVPDCEKLYTKLYGIIGSQVSEQCGKLAEYHDKGNYAEETIYRIAMRYLEDKTAKGILSSPSFRRLWDHSHKIMGTRFFWFITQLLRNEKIPFSYIPNAICIALHLLQSSHLNDYIEAAAQNDLNAFRKLGARLLDKHNFPLPENGEAMLRLALGQDQQIKYPLVHLRGKLINSQSSIDDIAPYIIEKYYLEYFPNQAAPLPHLFRSYRGFDHVSRCVVLFNVLLKVIEEESPKQLLNPQGKLLSEKEKTLLQLALLCHEAPSSTDAEKNRDRHAQAEIFRHEAELLGFTSLEFESIAVAIINKNVKGPSRNIYQWLIHDSDCLEHLRFGTNDPNGIRREELDIYDCFVKTNNQQGIVRITNIILKYKQLVASFMASDRVPLQKHSNCFLATQAFLYQLAIHHAIPSVSNNSEGSNIVFDPNSVGLLDMDPLSLFSPGPDFLRKVAENLESNLDRDESAKELFKTEGLYLRALGPVTTATTNVPGAAVTRAYAEESVLNKNRDIITKSKIADNAQLFWQGYEQNKLTGIKFRPATFIKEGIAILPYDSNNSVSLFIKVKNNQKALKFYKSNTVSHGIAQGNFTFQRTQDGIKAFSSVEDLEKKLLELNARRLGNDPDPYNRYYGAGTLERNETLLINYDLKEIVGIHIGNINNKNSLLEALYWYVRISVANQEQPGLYYFCPHTGTLASIPLKDLLNKYFNNVQIPSLVTHFSNLLGDIQTQNNLTITPAEISRAKITRTKLLGSLPTSSEPTALEVYNVELDTGKRFTAYLNHRGLPVIRMDGEAKPTYDRTGLFRQTIRIYQEQTAQNCLKLLLDAKGYLENKYRIVSIDIKIVHQPKKYLNIEREKNYLYCEIEFLESRFDNIPEVYIDKLQTLLGMSLDKKKAEVSIDTTRRKLTLMHRTPHKIIEFFEKLQRELLPMRKEKEVTSRDEQNAPQDDSHLKNCP